MIRYKLLGQVENADILKYYMDNSIDCFIHVSRNEGLPVAIMEAEGAGLPVIATDAGGIREMIEDNGILLPIDCSADDVANALINIVFADTKEKKRMRLKSRTIWEKSYNASQNAKEFFEHIDRNLGHRNHIIFVTEGYPFITKEVTFLSSELLEATKRYERVTIISRVHENITDHMRKESEDQLTKCVGNDALCKKISIIPYIEKYSRIDSLKYIFKFFSDNRIDTERRYIFKSDKRRLVRLWESIKYFCEAERFFGWFDRTGYFNAVDWSDAMIFTFWNLQPTLGFCLNRMKLGDVKIITRVHGYDYQDERWEKSLRKPFAETIDRLIDMVVFVSRTGMEWYLDRYNNSYEERKYMINYLGSEDPVTNMSISDIYCNGNDEVESDNKGSHRIVSCGSLIPLKRTSLIVDALKLLQNRRPDDDVEWIHFGDGPLHNDIEDLASKYFNKED